MLFLMSCRTSPPPSPADQEQIRQEREARRAEQEQKRAQAEQRRAEDDAHRAVELRRESEERLRRKFLEYSTADLKVMRSRYADYAERSGSGRDMNININRLRRREHDLENTERVIEIERELVRRWKSGDAEARLPEFENNTDRDSSK